MEQSNLSMVYSFQFCENGNSLLWLTVVESCDAVNDVDETFLNDFFLIKLFLLVVIILKLELSLRNAKGATEKERYQWGCYIEIGQ